MSKPTVRVRFMVYLFLGIAVVFIVFTNRAIMNAPMETAASISLVNIRAMVGNSFGAESPTGRPIQTHTSGYKFRYHRLRLWYAGRCIDSTDGETLTVQFCDPNIEQAFSLTKDNLLVYERTGKCVNYKINGTVTFLELTNCSYAAKPFIMEDKNGEFYIKHILGIEELCVSPMAVKNHFEVVTGPCLADPIGLTPCDHDASRILLMEESFFQEDRKLLKRAVVPPNSSCDFKACGFNKREPVKLLPVEEVERCTKLWECVTLVVKTTRRPHLVVRLAESVRETLGYDLPIVAYDDGPNDYSAESRQENAKYPLLRYIVSSNEDLGIARGRNLALMQVKTKYFFLLDDDIMFKNETKIEKLVAILDTTDATVASAAYMGTIAFTGFFHFGYFSDNPDIRMPRLGFFHKACTHVNQTVPNHPTCVRCDISSNVFLGRTAEILDIGGWDPELMTVEHKDIFIRVKAAGMKAVLCPEVTVRHARPKGVVQKGEGYNSKRRRGGGRFRALMASRWNYQNLFEASGPGSIKVNSTTGEIVYTTKKGRTGYC